MSAYIVNDETITKIINGLRNEKLLDRVALAAGYAGTLGAGYTQRQIGQDLLNLNTAAVNVAYKERNLPTDYTHTKELPENRPALYKSLCCFIYQCSEGVVTETNLYKCLEDVRHVLADRIVSDLKEYRNAEWG